MLLQCSALSHVRNKLFLNHYLKNKNPNTSKNLEHLCQIPNHVILMKIN